MNVLNKRRLTRSLALLVTSALMAGGALVSAGTASADAATTVSGTVRNQTGAKASASITVKGGSIDADGRFDQQDSAYVSLDDAGNFSVDAVAALGAAYPQYWLEVSGNGRVQANGVWHGTTARVPVALPSSVALVVAENAPSDQGIDVTVADVPVDTDVNLLRWDNQTGWRSAGWDRTDAAGKTSFSAYKNGHYTLRIYSTPTNHTQYIGGSAFAPESPTAPGTFATNSDPSATFTFAAVRSGTVFGRASWAGAAPTDPSVTLLRWYDSGDGSGYWYNQRSVDVNADASFKFEQLIPGGVYSLRFDNHNTNGTKSHSNTWLGGSTVPPVEKNDIASFVAAPGVTNDLGSIPITAVAGRINVELNGFLAGREISIQAYNVTRGYSTSVYKTLFASTGSKAIEGLEPGTYRVSAQHGTEGQSQYFAEALDVVVTSGGTATVSLTATPNALYLGEARLIAKIDGARRIGETVTARPLLTKAPSAFASAVTYRYVWRDGKQILGTGPSLKLTPAMRDKTAQIALWVHASAPGYLSMTSSVYLTTDQPSVDPGLRPVPTKAPSISGKVGFGKKLTANPGTWSPAPTSFTYQWLRNGAVIKGATAKTYKPRRADAGKRISVRVTPVLEGHESLAVTSLRTKALPKVSGTVKAKLAKKAIKAKSRAKVIVTVKSKGISPITGKVTVKAGKKSKTVTLKASKKGKVTVTLPKLKKGTYKIKVTYKGNSQVKKSTLKKTLTLKVK